MMNWKHALACMATSITFGTGSSLAAVVTYNLTTEFSGGTAPSGTYAVQLEDFAADTVRFTLITTAGLSTAEFVDAWYFNLDPNLDATDLSFSFVSVSGGNGGPTAGNTVFDSGNCLAGSTGSGSCTPSGTFKADGDGWFDIVVDFAQPNNQRFNAGETVVFDLTGITGLDIADFDFESVDSSNGTSWESAAHIQGIPPNSLSGWIGGPNGGGGTTETPEPGILALVGTALLAGGAMARRRRSVR